MPTSLTTRPLTDVEIEMSDYAALRSHVRLIQSRMLRLEVCINHAALLLNKQDDAWPQDWEIWRKEAQLLVPDFPVVAPILPTPKQEIQTAESLTPPEGTRVKPAAKSRR